MPVALSVASLRKTLRGGLAGFVAAIALLHFSAADCRAQYSATRKLTLFAGPGVVLSDSHARGAVQIGASFDEAFRRSRFGFLLEAGDVSDSAVLSANLMVWAREPHKHAPGTVPFATVGVSHLFGIANAVNFGAGFDHRLLKNIALRIEARDYFAFSSPKQNDVGVRLGVVFRLPE